MGNSNSQTLHPSSQSHQQWAHSYPRDPQHHRSRSQQPQVKVLPERIPGQRLRVTDNGAILHNGGTISGRKHSVGNNSRYSDEEDEPNERMYRARSSSNHRPPHPRSNNGLGKFNGKRFGSEPDLRLPTPHTHNDSPAKQRISRGRKKYRAPPPPPEGDSHGLDSSSPDSYQWDNLDPPARRLRLFKTREETKKGPGAQRQPRDIPDHARNGNDHAREHARNGNDHGHNIPDHGRNGNHHARNIPDHGRNGHDHGRTGPDHGRDLQEPSRNGIDRIRINVHDHQRTGADHNIRILVPDHARNGKDNGRDNQNIGKIRRGSREEKTSIDSLTAIPRVNGIRHNIQPHPPSPPPVQRSLSTPEFQAELLKAAQRLRPAGPHISRFDLNGNGDEFRGRDERRDDARRGRGEFRDLEFRDDFRREERKRDDSREDAFRRGRIESRDREEAREDRKREDFHRSRGDSRERELRGDAVRRGRPKSKDRELRADDMRGEARRDDGRRGRTEAREKGGDGRRRRGKSKEREPRKEDFRKGRERSKEKEPRERETRGAPVGAGPELRPRGDGSGRESTPEPVVPRRKHESRKESRKDNRKTQAQNESRKPADKHWEIITPTALKPLERDVPTKTFYFGMEQGERDAVDRFAASIHRVPPPPTPSGSGGSLCSEVEEEIDGTGSIALQLRPTLPKKQLEIPRFSPTAAWRLLSALETPTPMAVNEEVPVILEERIQRLSRPMAPPPPQQQHAPRSSHDKSGDSGISGDASPGGLHEDSSEAPLASPPIRKTLSPPLHPPRPLMAAWTPQQDLGEEESSSDGGVDESLQNALGAPPKFSPRAQVFSLSLPRDERLCLALYSENSRNKREVQPSFNSLKKLKRSVSGAFNALGTTTKGKEEEKMLDENWLLSRSVPNSLTSGHMKPNNSSTGSPSSPDHDLSQRTSFSYLATGGHVMYLPEYKSRQDVPDRSYPGLRAGGMMSKSCENISVTEMRELDRTPSPEMMIGRGVNGCLESDRKDSSNGKRSKSRRFTFQSTVRQIERRRISERLSRDAELKERRRLGELEAMRRVEEEFQRKRAPEKANIRHQLRLFNLDEQLFSSLPNGWTDSARAEPDGAASSSPNSSTRLPNGRASPELANQSASKDARAPQTQILSEFREPRRDYREYRPTRFSELNSEVPPEKRSTVHPPVVCDMPKSTQVYVSSPHRQTNGPSLDVDRGGMSTPRSSSSDNYRKDFAHGAIRSLASSDSELSQPNTRPHSRQRSRSPSPAMGRRSVSDPGSSSEEERSPEIQQTSTVGTNHINLTTVQPFSLSSKGYRPIAFTLGTKPSLNVAQPVN